MKVLLFADFRSPHALGWAKGLEEIGIETLRVASLDEVAEAAVDVRRGAGQQMARRLSAKSGHRIRTMEAILRQRSRRRALKQYVAEFRPDLVHALRLPYEGVSALSSLANDVPVVVSTWGQDFVAQAAADPVLRAWIRRTLSCASGLIADVPEDLGRARDYGLGDVPTAVAAANFGMTAAAPRQIDLESPMVTYTRGIGSHINYLEFIRAIPEIIARAKTNLRFTCIGLSSIGEARELATDPIVGPRIRLTGKIGLEEFNEIVRESSATCSPATSDGMPVSVLKSLAEGCATLVAPLPQFVDLASQTRSLVLMRGADRDDIIDAVLELDGLWAKRLGSTSSTPFVPEIYDRSRNAVIVPNFYARVLGAHG